jgi:RNA polymerase sigma factor (sigma-70 family)
MPTSPLSVVIRHLLAALRPEAEGMTDGELLARFLGSRDEDALAALVRRHAQMVWGVCRRLLHEHDAEDAFQATFLVLVRKATVVPREAVANWLYGVARQTAVRLRATAAKRGRREKQVGNMPEPQVEAVRDTNLQRVVDDELSRLPDHYRGVVVLCDLEGMTRKGAARELGIPEGSVASRLARARLMLAKRLTQRGIVFSSGAVATVLSVGSALSAPPALVASTIKAAGLQGAGVVSAKVAALTEGVVKAMFLSKMKMALSVALVLGLVATGATLLTYRTAAGQDGNKPIAEKPVQPPAKQQKEKVGLQAERNLSKIEPPGGVPLPLVEPGTKKIGVDQLNKVVKRLEAVPEKDLEQWVVELERIMDVKMKDGLPSPRQTCRTDFAIHMSIAFDDLSWNAKAADKLFKRACTMPTKEATAWKEAFESLLKERIGFEEAGAGEFSNLAGGPPWAVPLVLISVDALHDGQKYSVEHGKKYLARLKQLTKDDVSLWCDKVDKFGGTKLDATLNIILLDEFFSKESFQRDRFKTAVERQQEKK